jgi:hypothetical protein
VRVLLPLAIAAAFTVLQPVRQAPAVAPSQAPRSAMIWIGRNAEFEQFLKTAAIVRVENMSTGVTAPRHVFFAPGGLAAGAVAKAIKPDGTADLYDSYRSEIAAYELDKLLGMDLVPPTVERVLGRDRVSAQLWVEGCVTYQTVMNRPVADVEVWTRSLRRMVVFDNLIVNIDRNEGNMLIDAAGHVILIDHSRAFDARVKPLRMPNEKGMTAIDRPFFEKLKALDQQTLLAHVDPWVDFGVAPILLQRDAIVKRFERLIKENGEANVILK